MRNSLYVRYTSDARHSTNQSINSVNSGEILKLTNESSAWENRAENSIWCSPPACLVCMRWVCNLALYARCMHGILPLTRHQWRGHIRWEKSKIRTHRMQAPHTIRLCPAASAQKTRQSNRSAEHYYYFNSRLKVTPALRCLAGSCLLYIYRMD